MPKKRQLLTTEDAVPAKGQHTTPCSDCPWSRSALRGWLGGETVEAWIAEAHSDNMIPCHVLDGAQCAGAAIYRRNVCKRVRDEEVLRLPTDREKVFATPMEFTKHHQQDSERIRERSERSQIPYRGEEGEDEASDEDPS